MNRPYVESREPEAAQSRALVAEWTAVKIALAILGIIGAPLVAGGLCDPASAFLAEGVSGIRTNGLTALKSDETISYPSVTGASSIINAAGVSDAFQTAVGSAVSAFDVVPSGAWAGFYRVEQFGGWLLGDSLT